MINLKKELNPQQLQACEKLNGPLLILAGAGSGKTRVITYRITHMILDHGIAPYNILAITFTNKAAKEMKNRVNSLLDGNSQGTWISTFHALCLRILRQHIDKIGFEKDFVIYDAGDQRTLLKECILSLNLDKEKYIPKSVSWQISSMKNDLASVEDLKNGKKDFSFLDDSLIAIYERYQKRLKSYNALDFDDMIMYSVKLLKEHKETREYFLNLFKYIMVDEYQDTNHAQYTLIKLLAGDPEKANLCVVGDDDQSIYRWRGANVENIFNFENDFPGTTVVKLEENYRSTQNILDASNSVITNNDTRKGKQLWTNNDKGETLEYYQARNEGDEAEFVIKQIKDLCYKGYKHKDFAIFYRTNAQSRVIEDRLIRKGLPYQIIGGLKFYERKEIKDLLAYARVLVNQDDSISLKRIINIPRRSIGKTSVDKITNFAESKDLSFFAGMRGITKTDTLRRNTKIQLAQLVTIFDELIVYMVNESVSETFERLINKISYIKELEKLPVSEAEERIGNVKELIVAAKSYEENTTESSLKDFLDSISLSTDIDNYYEDEGSVTLMTFHSSKGLEFPVVFMVGMENNLFPHSRSIYNNEELEEERRLCYVGMTRAKKKLFFTNAKERRIYNELKLNPPSMFISEIPEDLITTINTETNSFSSFSVNTAKPVKVDNAPFGVGRKIDHSKWGVGTIRMKDGIGENAKITVVFPGIGIKKLSVKYAPIKMI